jgi:hypothetical protein
MAVDTSVSPYFDDYNTDDGFHRILYRPGRAVQARELTQQQSILQEQIKRFGQNIFLDGSAVLAAGVSVDTNYEYAKITNGSFGDVVAGATIVGSSSGLVAELIETVAAENSDPNTLYIKYTGGGSSEGGRFVDGETLTWTNPVSGSGSYTVDTSGTGTGTKVDLQEGWYFTRGFFVKATTQSLIIEKYGIPSGIQEIGLTVAESIVTSDTDGSLLDNANGTNNFNAPGADRLKYALNLIKRDDIVAGDDYFTVITLRDSTIVDKVDRSSYAIIGDEMARRTFDESGNYTIDPFLLTVAEHESDDTKLTLTFDPGKAYVRGYEIEKSLSTSIDVDKALSTEVKANGKTSTYFGNYIRVTSISGNPPVDDFDALNLRDSGSTIRGTARVRGIERESGSIYRLYLFDIQMNSGYSFNVVRTAANGAFSSTLIGEDDSALTTNSAQLYDVDRNNLLFEIPQSRVQSIEDITVRVQRHETQTTDGSGNVTLDTTSASITWEDTDDWIVIRSDTGAVVTPGGYGSTGAQTIAVSGLTASTEHIFIAYVDKTTATTNARTKTLTTVTDQVVASPGSGNIVLGESDIFVVDSVKDSDNSDADITDRYDLDNGQRDNFYQDGVLILKANQTAPTGNVKVSYKYFAHGAGDYFNVDSYNSLVSDPSYNYGDIPKHTLANGDVVRLSDVFDFRPKLNNPQTGYTGNGAAINELPQNNQTIQADVTYYVPRIDLLYIDAEGNFGSVTGAAALNPQAPNPPDNAMGIYRFGLFAGTIDASDVIPVFIENKRYTMRDIGKIENRIDRIEEWTTLSLLESDTATLEVLDANGNNRFKSGFFVDNFKDFTFTDFNSRENRSSVDPMIGESRPTFYEYNVGIRYTSSGSSGVTVVGDFLLMSYTEETEITQGVASSTINVNPYNVITNTGGITLSPETDEWRDVNTTTISNTIRETQAVNPNQGGNFDNWRWNWTGVPNQISNGIITPTQAGGLRGGNNRITDNNFATMVELIDF